MNYHREYHNNEDCDKLGMQFQLLGGREEDPKFEAWLHIKLSKIQLTRGGTRV